MDDRNETTAREVRESLAAAVATLDAVGRTSLRVGRGLRLENEGSDPALLRAFLTVKRGETGSRASLTFEWPKAVASHPAIQSLEGWSEQVTSNGGGGTSFEVRSEDAELADGRVATRLEVRFSPADCAAELTKLLALAERIGLVEKLRDALERESANGAARTTDGTPAQAPEPSPDQDKIDAIRAHDVFDPDLHPDVPLNGEVTNSDGVRFRLVLKRLGGARGLVWIRLPGSGATVRATPHRRPR